MFRWNEKKETELSQIASMLDETNKKFHKTLQKISDFEEKELELDNPANIEKLALFGISAEDIKAGFAKKKSEGYMSHDFYEKLSEARRILCRNRYDGHLFQERLRLADIVREDWSEGLVPFVIETICLIGNYSGEYSVKRLIAMYVVDNRISEQTEKEKSEKYAMISIALEYSGGLLNFLGKGYLWNESETEEIALRARNRLTKEKELTARFDDFIKKWEAGNYKKDMMMDFLMDDSYMVEQSEDDIGAEHELFLKYYEQVIEPVFFDVFDHGETYLGRPTDEFNVKCAIDRLGIKDDIDEKVVEYILNDARQALEIDSRAYTPFMIWGSERYFEMIGLLDAKAVQLKKKDDEIMVKVNEFLSFIKADVDINSFESLMQFGAEFGILVSHFAYHEEYFYIEKHLQRRNLSRNDIIQKYGKYGQTLSDAAQMDRYFHCMSSYFLHSVYHWASLFYEFYNFELHGNKTERKQRALYNKAKHCFNNTVNF